MDELDLYILRIPDYKTKSAAQLIDYFAFYLQQVCNQKAFTPSQIKQCFNELSLPPYSNISSYLSKNSGRNGKYIKQKSGYVLNRIEKENIAKDVQELIIPPASTNFLDLSIFEGTPYYINKTAEEMVHCYDSGYYNATLVLMRKLVETLIIECFERYGIDNDIKDEKGTFYYLSELIPRYITCSKWNASRNIKASIEAVKKYGDLSAHNRRFWAKKNDIDCFKFELRQALQEIILTIDYPSWQKNKT